MSATLAFVTGASGGIGRAVAIELARRGHPLLLGFRQRADEAATVRGAIVAAGGTADLCAFDAGSPSLCEEIEALLDKRGPVTSLVHCAGIVRASPFIRTTSKDWAEVIAVNLGAFHALSRAVLKPMIREHRGSIVAIGSVIGLRGLEGQAAYAASKAGLIGAVRSLAREVGPYNIRVNVVEPGWIESGMNEARSAAAIMQRIPLRRAGRAEDVADVVGFLCSDQASYVTGAVIPVSGGLDM